MTASCVLAVSEHGLVSEEAVFNARLLSVARLLLPLSSPDLANPLKSRVTLRLAFEQPGGRGPQFGVLMAQIRSSTSTPSASARADKVRAEPVRRPLSICDR